MKKMESVDYKEPYSIKVGKFLLSKGFTLSSWTGCASDSLVDSCVVGILYKEPKAEPRKYLFGLLTRKPLRAFIGTLRFRGMGSSEERWVLEAYGRQHVELLRQLAEEIASTFNAHISIRLECENIRFETTYEDDFSS